ncbi:MAG TPA: class I SAM-dependent methyltransferase [Actinomycetota bacterium]|nr:class I SAM-dependent methyltransferase [Actinomycetota bacterium]
MAEAELLSPRTAHARRLFAPLAGSYDRMALVLSLGQDPRWRRFLAGRVRVPPGARVLDVAAGTGAVAREVARATGAAVVGVDQSEPMVRLGAARAARGWPGPRARFVVGQAERLPFPDGAFEAVTFAYLLRYVDDPGATLAELARVLQPGGVMAGLEFHVPPGLLWRGLWFVYTRAGLPAVGALVSREWFEAGRFLGPSISRFARHHPLPAQLALWRGAGLEDVRYRLMSLGAAVVVWGRKRGA